MIEDLSSASLDTPHGTVAVNWRADDGKVTVDVTLPDGVSGVFRAPDGSETELADSGQLIMQIHA